AAEQRHLDRHRHHRPGGDRAVPGPAGLGREDGCGGVPDRAVPAVRPAAGGRRRRVGLDLRADPRLAEPGPGRRGARRPDHRLAGQPEHGAVRRPRHRRVGHRRLRLRHPALGAGQRRPRPHRRLAARRHQLGAAAALRHHPADHAGLPDDHDRHPDRGLRGVRPHLRDDRRWARGGHRRAGHLRLHQRLPAQPDQLRHHAGPGDHRAGGALRDRAEPPAAACLPPGDRGV
ncbi:MAG: ABC transporter, permease protein 1 (cluster 1, maltose/g3p/polyamine/iron), partial [uncultured Quadrisphaera sp.]